MTQKTLIDEVPEAQAFVAEVLDNIGHYLAFSGERFVSTIAGVASTSSADSQGERMSVGALEKVVQGMLGSARWTGVEHDPRIQPIGRAIAAKLFYSAYSDVHFVVVVTGFYDPKTLPTFSDAEAALGKDHSTEPTDDAEQRLDWSSPQAGIGFSPYEIPADLINEMLATAPPIVSRMPRREMRKAADPLAVLTILAKLYLLLANPFSKKFLEKLGEHAADEVKGFYDWLKHTVIEKLKMSKTKPLFELRTNVDGCLVQFVVETDDVELTRAAVDTIHSAAESAVQLAARLGPLEPEKIVYLFDSDSKSWAPAHAATVKMGVISDRPRLVALERYKGLSVAGDLPAQTDKSTGRESDG